MFFGSSKTFNPDRDIGDLSGKVYLVTGGTNGLGKESLLALAKHNPAHLYFTGRNAKGAESVVASLKATAPNVKVTFVPCDLTSFDSIREASAKVLADTDRLDVLMCNAGIMATAPGASKEGYEIQFGTNHVGHALLIKLLLPLLQKTTKLEGADVRIILLSSEGHTLAPAEGIDFAHLREADYDMGGMMGSAWTKYGQTKLANLLYATSLAKKYPDITSLSIHPGVVGTDLIGNLDFWKKILVYTLAYWSMVKPSEGAYNQVWAAAADLGDVRNGGYYIPVAKLQKSSKDDPELAEKLWEWTEKELSGISA